MQAILSRSPQNLAFPAEKGANKFAKNLRRDPRHLFSQVVKDFRELSEYDIGQKYTTRTWVYNDGTLQNAFARIKQVFTGFVQGKTVQQVLQNPPRDSQTDILFKFFQSADGRLSHQVTPEEGLGMLIDFNREDVCKNIREIAKKDDSSLREKEDLVKQFLRNH